MKTATLALLISIFSFLPSVSQSDEPLMGEIRMFAGTFAPRGWAFCDGQLLLISENQALFSLIGTTYGGDGRTTYALPDLRGRAPVHSGQGPGLREIRQGQKGGGTAVATAADPTDNTVNQPFIGIRYIIALQGIYPSRN